VFQETPGLGIDIEPDFDIFDGGLQDIVVGFFDPIDEIPDYAISDMIAEDLPILDWCAENHPDCLTKGLFGFIGLTQDELMEIGSPGPFLPPITMAGEDRWFTRSEYEADQLVVELVRDYTGYNLISTDITGNSYQELVTYSPTGLNSLDFGYESFVETNNHVSGRVSSNAVSRSRDLSNVFISGKIDIISGGTDGFGSGKINDFSSLSIAENLERIPHIPFFKLGFPHYHYGGDWININPYENDLTPNQINRRVLGLELLNNIEIASVGSEKMGVFGSYNCGENGEGCIFIIPNLANNFDRKTTLFDNYPEDSHHLPDYEDVCMNSFPIWCGQNDRACGRSLVTGDFNGNGKTDLAFSSGTRLTDNDYVYILLDITDTLESLGSTSQIGCFNSVDAKSAVGGAGNSLDRLDHITIDLNSVLGTTGVIGGNLKSVDMDGDGKGELVISVPGYSDLKGMVAILPGRASFQSEFNSLESFLTIEGNAGSFLGSSLTSGDYNSDGYGDIVISSFGDNGPFNSRSGLFYGSENFFEGIDTSSVFGCMNDPEACNYNPEATVDDGSCAVIDECGNCGGPGIPNGACDCEGNILDECGICGGDGSSCGRSEEEVANVRDPEVDLDTDVNPPTMDSGNTGEGIPDRFKLSDINPNLELNGGDLISFGRDPFSMFDADAEFEGGLSLNTFEHPGLNDVVISTGITLELSPLFTYQDITITNNYANEPKYGTLVNDPELRPDGVTNGAYYFDGVNDYISVKQIDGIKNLSNITVSVWIYPLGKNAEDEFGLEGYDKILGNSDDWNGGGFNFYLRDVEDEQYAFNINGSYIRTGNVIFDQWQQLVGTYDGETMKLYLDGELIGSEGDVSTRIVSNLNLLIGDIHNYESSENIIKETFNGMIDEVRVYDFAMTSDQIIENYNSDLQEKKDIVLNMPLDSNLWDYSPFKYDITNHSATGSSNGQVDDFYDFSSASTDYIEIDSSENLDVQNFTFSSWFRTSGPNISSPGIYMRSNNAGGNELFIGFNGLDYNRIFITLDGLYHYFFQAEDNLMDNQWHHIAARYDSSTLTVYIDGAQYDVSKSTTKTLDFGDSNAWIGADADGFNSNLGNYWNGGIDELKLFSRALSEEEILEIYNRENNGDKYIREIDRTILSSYTSLGDVFNTKVTQFYPNFTRKESVFSNNLTIRNNTLPVINSAILNSTDPSTNHTDENLTAHVQVTDNDGDNTKLLYDWYVNDELITVLNLPFEREQVIFASDFESEATAGPISCNERDQVLDDFFWSNVGESGVIDNAEDWIVVDNMGNNGSTGTGPVYDHTIGDSTGQYIYFETSTPCFGGDDEAWLMSILIDFDAYSEEQLTFWYHMYGANMGTLYVEENTTGSWEILWELTGQQQTSEGEAWREATVDLSDLSGQGSLRFKGVSGTGYTSDMALDDISFNAKYFGAFGLNGTLNYQPNGGFDSFGSFDFDGIDDYLEIENSEQLNVQDFTFSSWFKTDSHSSDGEDPVLFMRGNATGKNELGFFITSPTNFRVHLGGPSYNFDSGITLTDFNWHHVVVTYDSSTLRVYMDGQQYGLDEAVNDVLDFGDSNAWVGAEVDSFNSDFGNYWDGFIDDVTLYNRALSPEQVAVLFDNKTDEIVSQETEGDEVWKFDVLAYDFFGPGESMTSNNLTISGESDYNITVWIDGLESTEFANTAVPYLVTVNVKDNSTQLVVPDISVALNENNGNNLFLPLNENTFVSRSSSIGVTDGSGNVSFIIAPTDYSNSGYNLSVGVLSEGDLVSEISMSIGTSDSLTSIPTSFDPTSLTDHLKTSIFAQSQISNYLFKWANSGVAIYRNITVGSGFVSGDLSIKTGAVNLINVSLVGGEDGFIVAEESSGHLIFSPEMNHSSIGFRNHSSLSKSFSAGELFVISPTAYGFDSNVTITVYNLGGEIINTVELSVDNTLGFEGDNYVYIDDPLKTLTFKISQVLNNLFRSING